MRIPLAWHNLAHEKARTATATAGVTFAVVLILMQLGFYGAVWRTATIVYDQLNYDVLISSPEYLHFSEAGTFPRLRLRQAASVPGVEAARPLYVRFNLWKHRALPRRRGILVIGMRPRDEVFRAAEIVNVTRLLTRPDRMLLDTRSRPEFGRQSAGEQAEVGGRRLQVAGLYTLGTGFGADGDIIVSDETFVRLFPDRTVEDVSLGLVKVADGADPAQVARALDDVLPPDVQVRTRAQIAAAERNRWLWKTSVGFIFGSGVLLAAVVGMAVTYQVLSSDIANRLPEYATLKAMGYSFRYLAGVVVQQALILAVLGFVPGLAVSAVLYRVTAQLARIPIEMETSVVISVFVLSLAMCAAAALAAVNKVKRAAPAELF
jgi:putative ABC transport system permease protein